MKRSKTFGQILKVIAYLVFAYTIFLFVRKVLISPDTPNPSAHLSAISKASYDMGWYIGYYGAPVVTALIGGLLLRWGNKKVKRVA